MQLAPEATAVNRIVSGQTAIVTIRTRAFGDLVFRTSRSVRDVGATLHQVIDAARDVEKL